MKGSQKPNLLKESMKLNYMQIFQSGGVTQTNKLLVRGVWIFLGKIHLTFSWMIVPFQSVKVCNQVSENGSLLLVNVFMNNLDIHVLCERVMAWDTAFTQVNNTLKFSLTMRPRGKNKQRELNVLGSKLNFNISKGAYY